MGILSQIVWEIKKIIKLTLKIENKVKIKMKK
jgi:hypothetical protein